MIRTRIRQAKWATAATLVCSKGIGRRLFDPKSALLGGKFKFKKCGHSGMELSEVLPQIGEIADDICLIRSMQTDAVNHAPGQILM